MNPIIILLIVCIIAFLPLAYFVGLKAYLGILMLLILFGLLIFAMVWVYWYLFVRRE